MFCFSNLPENLSKHARDGIEFDFLVNGEFLRVPLKDHLQEREISQEAVVEIEYLEKHPAPEPENSLMHDDWVSAVAAKETWYGHPNFLLVQEMGV